MANELLIYCDESIASGQFYSNFYGAALTSSVHADKIIQALNVEKQLLNLHGEVKWSKITENYSEKYICLLNTFFDFIEEDKLKIRIMFTQNTNVPSRLTEYQRENSYFLLYYQFIKHAFGFCHHSPFNANTNVKLYFDRLPDTKEKVAQFKSYLLRGLSMNRKINNNGFLFKEENIAEVDSHKHVILQCTDIVLGAMQFRLNHLNIAKKPEEAKRGKRTIAKEKVYKHIQKRINQIYPNFNIGITTGGKRDPSNHWKHRYRHWLFVPANHTKDPTKTRKAKKLTGVI